MTVKYPYEYFAAPVYFAVKISEVLNIDLITAFEQYTGLYTEVTGKDYRSDKSSLVWRQIVNEISGTTDPAFIADALYNTYLAQPHSVFKPDASPEGIIRFGPLGLDCTPYNRERNTIRIHYMPQRFSVSELSSERFDELKENFRQLLKYAQKHYPEIQNFTSSTWVNAIPNFQKLFPKSFVERMVSEGGGSYLGLWGQFMKSDGSGNPDRLKEFTSKLDAATTLEEAIEAIPCKVYTAIGPLSDFYKEYNLA